MLCIFNFYLINLKKMNNRKIISIFAMIVAISLVLLLSYLGKKWLIDMKVFDDGISNWFFNGIIIWLFVYWLITYKDKNRAIQDERTKKISAYSISFSWFLTYLFIMWFFWINVFVKNSLTVNQNLAIVLFFMAISAMLSKLYFNTKPDLK